MTSFFLIGGLFLGWAFGRNNLSNVFGSAIGTRMVPFRTAALYTGIFILLGALLSGQATTASVLQLGDIPTLQDAFIISVCIGLVMFLAGPFGVPVSMVQASVGCLIGLNLYNNTSPDWPVVRDMAKAWCLSPFIALILTAFLFRGIRLLLYHVKIPILYRDRLTRWALIATGIFSAYSLGANNISTLVGPYQAAGVYSGPFLIILICTAVALGVQMADRRVIETVSTGLFPLSPLEAWIAIFANATVLLLFSSLTLTSWLQSIGLSVFVAPIPASCTLIGSIMGISCAKGCKGINPYALMKVIASWFIVPVFSGLICFIFLSIFKT